MSPEILPENASTSVVKNWFSSADLYAKQNFLMKQAVCFLMFKRFSTMGQFGWKENRSPKESSKFNCKNKRVAAYILYVCVAALLNSKRHIFTKYALAF